MESTSSDPIDNSIDRQLRELQQRNVELEAEVARLSKQVGRFSGNLVKCGYLNKYRPNMRFLEKPWELRFFTLHGTTLSYWKTERDAADHPRGTHSVEQCMVYVEGLKKATFFTFRIVDQAQNILLRLSTKNEGDGRHWVSCLEGAGLPVVSDEPDHPFLGQAEDPSMVKLRTEPKAEDSDSAESSLTDGSITREDGLRYRKTASERQAGISGLHVAPPVKTGGSDQAGSPSPRKRSVGYTLRASAPCHKRNTESPLSQHAIFQQSHAGLFNLSVVILLAVNSRLIIENLMKYGLLLRFDISHLTQALRDWPLLVCALSVPLFPVLAVQLEKWKRRSPALSERVVGILHTINIVVTLVWPAWFIYETQAGEWSSFALIFVVTITWMKLISYAHTNYDVRSLLRAGEQPESVPDAHAVRYPDNITYGNMVYFLAAPTLCYQLAYPRTPYIRWPWIGRQLIKLVIFSSLLLFIINQYVNPTVANSPHPLSGSVPRVMERVLKLSIPTLYVWLCMFYCFFHLWLNILAELLRFGDREFYKDWWNATTIEGYWRSWNMPVHRWMVRHIYFPCIRRGLKKGHAMVVVFSLSAVFHELLIGLPCHTMRLWAFIGIMNQLPLVLITNVLAKRYESKPMIGNMIFWVVFCVIGQPTCVLLYYHDIMNRKIKPTSAIDMASFASILA